jgi:hypothetical protein
MATGEVMTKENVSLRDHFESRLTSLEKATEVAKKEMDRRLDSMNEFREQLRKQEGTFLTKENYEPRHEALAQQIKELQLDRARVEGKASITSVYISYALSIISILLALAKILK